MADRAAQASANGMASANGAANGHAGHPVMSDALYEVRPRPQMAARRHRVLSRSRPQRRQGLPVARARALRTDLRRLRDFGLCDARPCRRAPPAACVSWAVPRR